MNNDSMILHCGAATVTREEVDNVPQAARLGRRHYPVSHGDLLRHVETALVGLGVTVANAAYALNHQGAQMFALFHLGLGDNTLRAVIGIRNDNQQRFAASIVGGTSVFVCDNLAFSGEIFAGHKHTRFAQATLPGRISSALRGLPQLARHEIERHQRLEQIAMPKGMSDRLIMESVRRNVIPPSAVRKLDAEWREPSHDEFKPRTLWSWENAGTEVLKRYDGPARVAPAIRLRGLVDEAAKYLG